MERQTYIQPNFIGDNSIDIKGIMGTATVFLNAFGAPGRVSAVNNPHIFTGREYDPYPGLYRYRAKDHLPKPCEREQFGRIDE